METASGMAGMKDTAIDEVNHVGKATSISADSFAQRIKTMNTTVQSHDSTIGSLVANYSGLEQQVKAIARVMASQNVGKLAEHLRLAQDDMKQSLTQYINEKSHETLGLVQKEVADVIDAKHGLDRKIDTVEQRIMATLGAKLDDAAGMRHAMREELEKVRDAMEDVPSIADKNSKYIKALETKIIDLKNQFREFERVHEKENLEQDKQVAALDSEIRTTLANGLETLVDKDKQLSTSLKGHEISVDEKLKTLNDTLEQEIKDRTDMGKTIAPMIADNLSKVRDELQKTASHFESAIDHSTKTMQSSVQELKRLVIEEKVHREVTDKELARSLSKEIENRHHDEERLVALIATCQATVAKMHKA